MIVDALCAKVNISYLRVEKHVAMTLYLFMTREAASFDTSQFDVSSLGFFLLKV